MGKTLTQKQQKFAKGYLETGNATEAANRAYKPKNRATARAIGSENLTKPNIKAFLDEKAYDAATGIYELSQRSKNDNVRLNACKDILDRAGHAADKNKMADNLYDRLPSMVDVLMDQNLLNRLSKLTGMDERELKDLIGKVIRRKTLGIEITPAGAEKYGIV